MHNSNWHTRNLSACAPSIQESINELERQEKADVRRMQKRTFIFVCISAVCQLVGLIVVLLRK